MPQRILHRRLLARRPAIGIAVSERQGSGDQRWLRARAVGCCPRLWRISWQPAAIACFVVSTRRGADSGVLPAEFVAVVDLSH